MAASLQGAASQAHTDHQQKWQLEAERIRKDPMKAFASAMRGFQVAFSAASHPQDGGERDAVEGGLTFSMFELMVRDLLYLRGVTTSRARGWFDACDPDGNGLVSLLEFFRFSARAAAHQCSMLLRQPESKGETKGDGKSDGAKGSVAQFVGEVLVQAFDKTGDGQIDKVEFGRMADKLGFGETAEPVFSALDHDHSGVVSTVELVQLMRSPGATREALAATTDFVMAMIQNGHAVRARERAAAAALITPSDSGPLVELSTIRRLSSAVVTPPSGLLIGGIGMETPRRIERARALEAFRVELVDALHARRTRAVDLFAALDCDADHRIKRKEMHPALRSLLQTDTLPAGVTDAIFDELDADSSNVIYYEELAQWLQRGDVPRLDLALPSPRDQPRRPAATASAGAPGSAGAMLIQTRRHAPPPTSAREQLAYRSKLLGTDGTSTPHRGAPSPPVRRDRFAPAVAAASPRSPLQMHICNGESQAKILARPAPDLDGRNTPRVRKADFTWSPMMLDMLWTAQAAPGAHVGATPSRSVRKWRDAPLRRHERLIKK